MPHYSKNQHENQAPPGPLGNTAKSVDQSVADKAARERRATAFRLQRRAAAILPKERVGLCRWAVVSREAGVDIHLTSYDGGALRASYAGLQTCSSVWLCPCCGRRISETRRGELNRLLAWARERGLQPVMVTLTTRHGIRDKLSDQLDAMKRAKQRLRQRREWRSLKGRIAGTVTATEVTHGQNGWHTHFHEILLMDATDESEALAMLRGLNRVWRACLIGVGLSGGRAAWQAQGAGAAGQYVAKWGAGEELTMTGAKRGRGKGRTPLQLLADADEGNDKAAGLWRVYALAFQGRRQLVWSPGLKAAAGIDELSDEDAASDEAQDDSEVEPILNIEHEGWVGHQGWRGARHRRARVLDAAEMGGAVAAAAVVKDGGVDPCPGPDPGPLLDAGDDEHEQPIYVSHEEMSEMPEGIDIDDILEEAQRCAVERQERRQQSHEAWVQLGVGGEGRSPCVASQVRGGGLPAGRRR